MHATIRRLTVQVKVVALAEQVAYPCSSAMICKIRANFNLISIYYFYYVII